MLRFLKAFVIMLVVVELMMGFIFAACIGAAVVAFYGESYAPPIPWFLVKFFAVLGAFFSLACAGLSCLSGGGDDPTTPQEAGK